MITCIIEESCFLTSIVIVMNMMIIVVMTNHTNSVNSNHNRDDDDDDDNKIDHIDDTMGWDHFHHFFFPFANFHKHHLTT